MERRTFVDGHTIAAACSTMHRPGVAPRGILKQETTHVLPTELFNVEAILERLLPWVRGKSDLSPSPA